MTRGFTEGDKVYIHMNDNASLDRCAFNRDTWIIWTVTHMPSDTGDSWHFECGGQVISVNPMSANFDGLELVVESK